MTWAPWQRRYLVLTLLLLLPFAVDGLARLGLGGLVLLRWLRVSGLEVVIAAIALVWIGGVIDLYRSLDPSAPSSDVRTYHGFAWLGENGWSKAYDPELLDWIQAGTARADILAHPTPWPLTFFTERPSVLLPREASARLLRKFLVDYHVAYVPLAPRLLDGRLYQGYLEALQPEGVRAQTIGSYVVFDTRALWQ
jgi:hypothetical protein